MFGAAAVLSCGEAMSDLSDWPKNECHSKKKRERERERDWTLGLMNLKGSRATENELKVTRWGRGTGG